MSYSVALVEPIHTSHFRNCHGSMLRDGISALARQTGERICGGQVDDNTPTDVARPVPTLPCFRGLLAHSRRLCAYAEEISPRIDIHDSIEILDNRISQRCVCTVINLRYLANMGHMSTRGEISMKCQ